MGAALAIRDDPTPEALRRCRHLWTAPCSEGAVHRCNNANYRNSLSDRKELIDR